MKTILVTGANGQLGNSIRQLSAGYPQFAFVFTDVDTLDICDAQAVDAFVREKQADYILNCAAYTAVDKAEEEEALCLRINRDAVRNLGEAARAAGARMVHVSTDYVFDGTNYLPYVETDKTCRLLSTGVRNLPVNRLCRKFAPMRSSSVRHGFTPSSVLILSRRCCGWEMNGNSCLSCSTRSVRRRMRGIWRRLSWLCWYGPRKVHSFRVSTISPMKGFAAGMTLR